jgi:hypothetical protein
MTKREYRNPEQIQMTKIQMTKTKAYAAFLTGSRLQCQIFFIFPEAFLDWNWISGIINP